MEPGTAAKYLAAAIEHNGGPVPGQQWLDALRKSCTAREVADVRAAVKRIGRLQDFIVCHGSAADITIIRTSDNIVLNLSKLPSSRATHAPAPLSLASQRKSSAASSHHGLGQAEGFVRFVPNPDYNAAAAECEQPPMVVCHHLANDNPSQQGLLEMGPRCIEATELLARTAKDKLVFLSSLHPAVRRVLASENEVTPGFTDGLTEVQLTYGQRLLFFSHTDGGILRCRGLEAELNVKARPVLFRILSSFKGGVTTKAAAQQQQQQQSSKAVDTITFAHLDHTCQEVKRASVHEIEEGGGGAAASFAPLPVTGTKETAISPSAGNGFDTSNRGGLTGTLHRICAIRANGIAAAAGGMRSGSNGALMSLTCRVGRSVPGCLFAIQDLVASGKSILLLGAPGTGKTTLLREMARLVSTVMQKNVIVVDTSKEIGGASMKPHPSIGRARRMWPRRREEQHKTMVEAVSNHTPQVLVIDEISTLREAKAARNIKQRGVRLFGTAHGTVLTDLMTSPDLKELVGSPHSVILSSKEKEARDKSAGTEGRQRESSKTVQERRQPSVFDVCIELHARNNWTIHHRLDYAMQVSGKARDNSNRKRNETHETLLARARRCAPPRPHWTAMRSCATESPTRRGGSGKRLAAR